MYVHVYTYDHARAPARARAHTHTHTCTRFYTLETKQPKTARHTLMYLIDDWEASLHNRTVGDKQPAGVSVIWGDTHCRWERLQILPFTLHTSL